MAQNLIRVKQLNTSELSGFVSDTIASTGTLYDVFVSRVADQTISGLKTFVNGINVSGSGIFDALDLNNIDILSLSGVDVTIKSGNVILTNPLSSPNLVYNTGNQTISGVKTFATGIIAQNLVYNTGNQTISGVKTFASMPNVNSTGLLLSGQNCFIVNLYNTSDTQALGHNYFGNLSMGFSPNQNSRRFPILETCLVKKATWTQVHGGVGSPAQNSTGYFINTSTIATGIISTTLNSTSSATTHTAEFSPPIIISNGDQIVCSLFGPSYTTTFPSTVRNSVNLYCYN